MSSAIACKSDAAKFMPYCVDCAVIASIEGFRLCNCVLYYSMTDSTLIFIPVRHFLFIQRVSFLCGIVMPWAGSAVVSRA